MNQPTTTFVGSTITTTPYNNPTAGNPVTVNLTINQSPAPNGTQVNLTTSGACSITASAATVGGVATFSNLIGTAGTGSS